jgi:hypothetical protein
MHIRSLITVLLTILLFAFLTASIRAQNTNHFEVDVPFEFVIAGRDLPPGTYSIGRADTSKPNILRLKNVDSGIIQTVLCQRVEKEMPSKTAFLLFTQRDGKFFLSEVWEDDSRSGNQVPIDTKQRHKRQDTRSLIVEARKNSDRSKHP